MNPIIILDILETVVIIYVNTTFRIDNNQRIYQFDQFEYLINEDLLKAKNIEIMRFLMLVRSADPMYEKKVGLFALRVRSRGA